MELSPVAAGRAAEIKDGVTRDESIAMRRAAEAFEASFLTEMLKHSGINRTSQSFGGGAGEDAFGSLLTRAYAEKIAASGGIGLAEHIYRSLINTGNTP